MDHSDPNGGQDLVEDLRAEISGMAKQGLEHPSTSPVLTGAAVGAIAAGVLPLISWPVGLLAGAAYVLYRRVKS